MHTKRHNYATI